MNKPANATAQAPQTQNTEQLQLVSFSVANELFAVDILRVQEINRMMALTKVPQSPPSVEGVINLRGRIIPVLDLRVQFGFQKQEATEQTRIIVIEVSGNTLGFIVDSVREVMRISSSIVDPAPQVGTSIDSSYVSGVAKLEDQLLIMLELENLLSPESLNSITSMKAAA
ncbi:MAG: chemotaxis protein CheW [Phycisphaerales bacterium]|nr:chemotaxis protein CheW [Phycisphaerales bacterium]